MTNIRRLYTFIVAAVSLQAVTWALIALLRNILVPLAGRVTTNTNNMAWQLAVIIVGLPVFLIHWLQAQKLAAQDREERAMPLRRLYLLAMMTFFLFPLLANTYGFLASLLRIILQVRPIIPQWSSQLPNTPNLIFTGTAVLLLAIGWAYHAREIANDRRVIPDAEPLAALNRFYLYLFTATGLVLFSRGSISLLRWLIDSLLARRGDIRPPENLIQALTPLIIGLGLWLVCWIKAQRLFHTGGMAEQESFLRKFYLYLVIFIASLSFVTSFTIILAGIIRRLLALEPQSGLGNVLSLAITAGVLWGYHAVVLQEDEKLIKEAVQQSGIRRLYRYLIAGIGLSALLIGVGGLISLLIDSFGSTIYNQDRELLAWFSAAAISGLIVWLLPWRKIQQEIHDPEPQAAAARDSQVRRIFLYFFLLVATLTFLGCGIFILYNIIGRFLGATLTYRGNLDIAKAVAFALLAVAIWIYHGLLLRQDQEHLDAVERRKMAEFQIAVVDDQDGRLGRQIIETIQAKMPGIIIHPIGLNDEAKALMASQDETRPAPEILASVNIITGPWSIVSTFMGADDPDDTIRQAIINSPAQKILVPKRVPGWHITGVDDLRLDTLVEQTVKGVRQIIAGDTVTIKKPLGLIPSIFLTLAAIIILFLLIQVILSFIFGF